MPLPSIDLTLLGQKPYFREGHFKAVKSETGFEAVTFRLNRNQLIVSDAGIGHFLVPSAHH
jgi:hypothetical protein